MTLDNFLDIIKHTSGLGFIEMVKLTGTNTDVKLEAMDDDRTVVVNATLKNPIDGLDGTIGLSRLGILSGYLNFAPFAESSASVEIKTQKRANGDEVPAEIKFDSGLGHVAHYRFMSAEIAEEQIKVPPFKGATWQVVITPTKSAMKDLSAMNSILGSFESTFSVRTNDDNLEFLIGSGASDRTTIVFAKDIQGELKHQWSWPLAQVLAILKLHESSASCTMSFSDQGALQIEIDSGLGTYQYILPARN
jgi:hypothetical protein